jgi:GxxExxY protein
MGREIDSITEGIIGDAIAVHRELGPGLLESTYEVCLHALLSRRGWNVERQAPLPVVFQGEKLDCGYRLDLWVDRRVVVEVKAVARVSPLHFAQMLTYLKLSESDVGLLINFNVLRLVDGVRRVVRGYRTPPTLRPSAFDDCENVTAPDSTA